MGSGDQDGEVGEDGEDGEVGEVGVIVESRQYWDFEDCWEEDMRIR